MDNNKELIVSLGSAMPETSDFNYERIFPIIKTPAQALAAADARIAEQDRELGRAKIYAEEGHQVDSEIIAGLKARIAEQGAEIERLREILTFDCTGYPEMEDAAIKWANKISGPKGGKPFCPDPIGILELCEDVAKAALTQPIYPLIV